MCSFTKHALSVIYIPCSFGFRIYIHICNIAEIKLGYGDGGVTGQRMLMATIVRWEKMPLSFLFCLVYTLPLFICVCFFLKLVLIWQVFSATNVELVTKTRTEHLTDAEKEKSLPRSPLQSFLNIAEVEEKQNSPSSSEGVCTKSSLILCALGSYLIRLVKCIWAFHFEK